MLCILMIALFFIYICLRTRSLVCASSLPVFLIGTFNLDSFTRCKKRPKCITVRTRKILFGGKRVKIDYDWFVKITQALALK